MRFPALLLLIAAALAPAEDRYQKPPKDVETGLTAPGTPRISVNSSKTYVLLLETLRNPPIADVARPMLRLAGLRIDPANNGPHQEIVSTAMVLKRISDGSEVRIQPGPNSRIGQLRWTADGKRFAFTNSTPHAIELWVGETATGKVHRIEGLHVNAVLAPTTPFRPNNPVFDWMPDSRTLVVQTVVANRKPVPDEPAVPLGPHIQESLGHAGPARTYEDMLQNTRDEDVFEYYATAQLAWVDADSGKVEPFGKPGIYETVQPSPGGSDLLIARVHRPFSYLHPVEAFPKDVEVWDRSAKVVFKVASLPLEDRVPIEGVPTGPRAIEWRPTEPATLVWAEALDGGNPKERAPHRDRILMAKAPFKGEPVEVFQTEQRFRGMQFGEKGQMALVSDYERDRKWLRTFVIDPDKPGTPPKELWGLNIQDRYHNPGSPVMAAVANGQAVIHQAGGSIFLTGDGSSPKGDHPFVDRLDLESGKSSRLFQSEPGVYESFVALLDDNGSKVLTLRESQKDPPNYFIRTLDGKSEPKAFTHFADPDPQLRLIKRQLVTYKREDGVPLSFTLYLPPNYRPGTRLPTVVWAYPLEYTDTDTASQISGSTDRFFAINGRGNMHLLFALQGYAVLDNAAMPIVGSPETVNNTYLEQLVSDAKAAIDKAVEMGVTDHDRVGVGGHSYGAFMTANLLAHSNLFRAGIARSGAYNRTLTPFSFQSERRTLWEAPDVYLRMSPFLSANKIKAPLLLIHGEADDNQGTFPIQSERMYQAVRGNGGIVRLVMLPAEPHGYLARETLEHVMYESIEWFDRYVKNAEAPIQNTGSGSQ